MTEATPEDLQEQQLTPTGEVPSTEPPAVEDGVPVADALEQAEPAGPGEHRAPTGVPGEADDLDVAEQAVVVPLDEDDAPRE